MLLGRELASIFIGFGRGRLESDSRSSRAPAGAAWLAFPLSRPPWHSHPTRNWNPNGTDGKKSRAFDLIPSLALGE
jgi:hypothetical protein